MWRHGSQSSTRKQELEQLTTATGPSRTGQAWLWGTSAGATSSLHLQLACVGAHRVQNTEGSYWRLPQVPEPCSGCATHRLHDVALHAWQRCRLSLPCPAACPCPCCLPVSQALM